MSITVILYIVTVGLLTAGLWLLDKLVQIRRERNEALEEHKHLQMVNRCLQTQRDILLDRLHVEYNVSNMSLETPGTCTIDELLGKTDGSIGAIQE